MKISQWFVVPKFGLSDFSYYDYVGFSLFIAIVKFKVNYKEAMELEELSIEDKIKSKMLTNTVLLLVLLLGYILKLLENGL